MGQAADLIPKCPQLVGLDQAETVGKVTADISQMGGKNPNS